MGLMVMTTNQYESEQDFLLRMQRQRKEQEAFAALLMMLFEGFGINDKSIIKPEDISEEKISSHPLFKASHPEYSRSGVDQSYPQAFNRSAHGIPTTSDFFSNKTYGDAALRTALSIGIENYTQGCIDRGVKYGFGVKDGQSKIDCSGFVANSVQAMLQVAGVKDNSIKAMFTTHSNDQVIQTARKTGFLLEGDNVNISNLRAGMIIGIDSGNKGWDSGRSAGVDHIGIVYADSKTGKLMFAESRGGKGVMTTPLDEYLAKADSKGYKLFAADPVKLALDKGHEAQLTASTASLLKPSGSGLKIPVT